MDSEKSETINFLKAAHKQAVDRFETYISENNKGVSFPSMKELKKYLKKRDELVDRVMEAERMLDWIKGKQT